MKGGGSRRRKLIHEYNPVHCPAGDHTATLKLSVLGGPSRTINVRGVLPTGKLELRPRALRFGSVPVGVKTSATVSIANTGAADTSWRVVDTADAQCTPETAVVRAAGSESVTVSVTPAAAGSIDGAICIEGRDGTRLRLPVAAMAEIARTSVLEEKLEFGSLYRGAHSALPCSISNASAFPATVAIDLNEHPAFSLRLWSHGRDQDTDAECLSVVKGLNGCEPSLSLATVRVHRVRSGVCEIATRRGALRVRTPQIYGANWGLQGCERELRGSLLRGRCASCEHHHAAARLHRGRSRRRRLHAALSDPGGRR